MPLPTLGDAAHFLRKAIASDGYYNKFAGKIQVLFCRRGNLPCRFVNDRIRQGLFFTFSLVYDKMIIYIRYARRKPMEKTIVSTNPPVANGEDGFIFISYSHKDKAVVYEDLWSIYERGFPFWYDDGITAGEVWNETVQKQIENPKCKLVIFFVSENTIASTAIRKEMELVRQNSKPFFTINITNIEVQELIAKAISAKQIRFSDMPLLASFFDEDIIYVKRSEPEYLNNVARHCIKHGFEAKVEVVTVKHLTKKVLILCKNSSFSNSIINGVYDFLSTKENIIIDKKLIDKNLNRLECSVEFCRILSENIDNYDGFILRTPDKYSDRLISCFNKIMSLGKKIVLLDIELSPDKMPGGDMPSYVGSDFVSGGLLLGERIGDLLSKFGISNSSVVLFEGPYSNNSAKVRCDSLYEKLIATAPNANILRYTLPSLNAAAALNYIKDQAPEWEKSKLFSGKTVVLFCGIDNIAIEVMRLVTKNEEFSTLNRVLRSAKKVIIVGYDGIRDANNEIVLKNYGIDFITIDVVPFKQGVNTGEKMYSLLFEHQSNGKILTKPELVEYIKFAQEKYSGAKDIKFLLNNKKGFIFDLDGTIADTETLHWDAYNILLAEYGVHLNNEHIRKYIGHSEAYIYQMIKQDFAIDFDEDDFIERRINIYLSLVVEKNLRPYPFIYEILESTNGANVIVTSQIPLVVNKLLTLWGLDKYFPANRRFCCHDGKYTKQEIYKNISAYLGYEHTLSPNEVVLLEDAQHYLTEGQRRGFTVIGVEHQFNRNRLKNCDAILSSSLHRGAFVGLCGLDAVYYGNGSLPIEDTKISIRDFSLSVGGPAANAAIAYAKLGAEAYLITKIGDSAEGILLKSKLKELNVRVIDLDANNKEGNCNISFVYINQQKGTRTIFSGQTPPSDAFMVDFEDVIKKADFVLYDGNLPQAEAKMIRYIEYYDKDLVIDAGSYKAGFPECFYRATTVISSEKFEDKNGNDVFALQKKYGFRYSAKTRGGDSIIYNNDFDLTEIELLNIRAVDTLGAGDVIHGAFCYFFYVKKLPFAEALEMASRVATLSVAKKGVVNGLDYAINNLF